MKHPLIQWVNATHFQSGVTLPPIGAIVRVNYRIREGEKERIQAFQGRVIKHHGGNASMGATFTVRKDAAGFGVERTFPLHSPLVESITKQSQGRVRRAKLYYMRALTGKKSRLREVRHA